MTERSRGKATLRLTRDVLLTTFVLCTFAGRAGAQIRPMSLDQITRLLDARVPAAQIVLTAGEACLGFELDDNARRRLRDHSADVELIAALDSTCRRIEAVAAPTSAIGAKAGGDVALPFDPGSAFRRSLIVPGLDQFRTRRTVRGALLLGAWSAAIGFGIASREVAIECLDRVTGTCPADRVRGESVTRPHLTAGLAAAFAISLLSALDARSAALASNREAVAQQTRTSGTQWLTPQLAASGDGSASFEFRIRW